MKKLWFFKLKLFLSSENMASYHPFAIGQNKQLQKLSTRFKRGKANNSKTKLTESDFAEEDGEVAALVEQVVAGLDPENPLQKLLGDVSDPVHFPDRKGPDEVLDCLGVGRKLELPVRLFLIGANLDNWKQ